MKSRLLVAAAACAALAIAGCSSSGGGGGSSSTPTGGSSAGNTASTGKTTTVGRFSFPAGKATGSPIKIGVVTFLNGIPQLANGIQAAADYANANFNGIAGHKIQIDLCDEKTDPTIASQCSPRFVRDKVAAVIGFPSVWLAIGGLKGLEAANIPWLGLGQPPASSAPNSYPIVAGDIQYIDFAPLFKQEGISHVTVISVDFPATVTAVKGVLKKAWTPAGITIDKSVFYQSAAADISTPAADAISAHSQAIYLNVGAQDIARFAGALRQGGYKGKIFGSFAGLTPQLYPSASKVMTGVTVETGQLLYFNDKTNPEAALARAIASSKKVPLDSFSTTGISQLLTLVDIGNHVGKDISAPKVLDYLKNVTAQKVFLGYQMDKSQIPSNLPELSHITNTFARFMVYNGKEFTYVGGWQSLYGQAKPGVGAGG